MDDADILLLANVNQWRNWLTKNDETSNGVWLMLAKKNVTEPTSLSYVDAVEEALCSGWIDGQVKKYDDKTHLQRFTPRRARSLWSARNVERIGKLTEEGRMRPRGVAEVQRAQADGRWGNAYKGAATIEVHEDLAAALEANPKAASAFETLSGQNRYAVLFRVATATSAKTRANRIEKIVEKLAVGETPYPQNEK